MKPRFDRHLGEKYLRQLKLSELKRAAVSSEIIGDFY